jgi:heme ABC exporter ATP-binding subunit CcmA
MSAHPSPDRPLLEAVGLVKRFGFRAVLRGLDLCVPRGQAIALMGANGAGKSTLMRLLTGLTRPDGGVLTVGGWVMPREAAQVRPHLGYVAHKPLVYDGLTARENLLFFGRLYGLAGAALHERADDLLAQVGLKKRAHDVVRGFSRGMLQRLSIARALLHAPDILLLDEPFTGLDLNGVEVLSGLVEAKRAAGCTIILTTHDPAHALRLCERLVVLARGGLVVDSPTSAYATPEALATAYAEGVAG